VKSLELLKNEFSKVFIEAVSSKSVEACTNLVVSYDEQNILFGKDGFGMKEEAYKEALTKQCQAFFKKWDTFIDEKNAHAHTKLILDNLDGVHTYSFEIHDEPFQFLKTISISMKEYKKEKKIHQVGFEIDNPLFINGRLALNNMLLTKCYESFWDDLENIPYKNKIHTLDEFKSLVKDVDDSETLEGMFDAYNAYNEWYLYDGDLELEKFDEKVNLVVTGNLTVKEPLVEITTELIVFGKTIVNAMYLDEGNNVFFLEGVDFNVALLSTMPGPYRVINNPRGPFLYSDSDSTIVNNPEKVKCYADYVYGKSHGDILSMLKEKYINRDEPYEGEEIEEDDYYIDAAQIAEDIRLSENIFNNSDDVAHYVEVKKPDLDDKESLMTLLKEDGLQFKKLDEKYRADKELINIVIENNEVAFKYIADELKDDRDYVLSMIKKNGRLLKYVSKVYKKDREIVLAAIDGVAYALDYAHSSLKKDKDVVLRAIKKDPSALEYADESLHADEEILLYVIEHDVSSFKYASESVIDNENIMLALVKKDPKYLGVEPLYRYKNDKAFILKVLEETPRAFNYLSKKMQKDEDVLELIK